MAQRTAQLAKMMQNLQVFIDHAPLSIAMLDRDMNYLAASGRWIEEFGRGHQELVGLNHYQVHPDIPATWKTAHQRALAGETLHNAEDLWLQADGSQHWLRWAVLPWRDAAGEIGGIIISTEDITASKQLAQDLSESHQKAVRLAQVKSDFLANMSHEIRTPLHAIVGLTHLLQASNPSLTQGEMLGRIAVSAEHLVSVVSDVLDMTKIEAGKLELERTAFRLAQLCDTLDQLIRGSAEAKGLTLALDCPTRVLGMALLGDPKRLAQVLVNLASNAVKFTEHGGVTLRVAVADETDAQIGLRFEVNDTGIGIDEQALPRLLSEFEQIDNSTTRRYGGTGLGLAICCRLLELMGSRIDAVSRPGVGSSFRFMLQLDKQRGAEPSADDGRPAEEVGRVLQARHHGARVLLAEDEPVNQMIATELLSARGLRVDLAKDGLQAVEMALTAPYDLILMDMQMPGLNGIEATRRIRAAAAGRRVPILAMTANAFFDDRQRCLDAGMDDFLTKPVMPRVLYAALLKYLAPGVPEERGSEKAEGRSA